MNAGSALHDYGPMIWIIFVLMGLVTTLLRSSFIVLGSRVSMPSLVQRALRYAPAAALAAIVVPDVLLVAGEFMPLSPKLAAAAAAVAAALLTRNPWAPFIAGMGVLLGIKYFIGA